MSVCKLESYLITRIKVQCCDLYICLSTYVKFAQKKPQFFSVRIFQSALPHMAKCRYFYTETHSSQLKVKIAELVLF